MNALEENDSNIVKQGWGIRVQWERSLRLYRRLYQWLYLGWGASSQAVARVATSCQETCLPEENFLIKPSGAAHELLPICDSANSTMAANSPLLNFSS
jgi:hypothetical protein